MHNICSNLMSIYSVEGFNIFCKFKKIAIFPIIFFLLLNMVSCGTNGGEESGRGGDDVHGGNGSGSTSSSSSSGYINLSWDAPTINSDGSPLTDLAGYKVYYGTSSYIYTHSVDIGA